MEKSCRLIFWTQSIWYPVHNIRNLKVSFHFLAQINLIEIICSLHKLKDHCIEISRNRLKNIEFRFGINASIFLLLNFLTERSLKYYNCNFVFILNAIVISKYFYIQWTLILIFEVFIFLKASQLFVSNFIWSYFHLWNIDYLIE
jgi:hypothetical protein